MKTLPGAKPRDAYLDLIRRFPLRPIRDDAQADQAAKILDRYFPRGDLDAGTADYIHALATLLADYQDRCHPVETAHITPLSLLRHLMEQHDMSTADLGRLLGNSGLASMILHGKRGISKNNAKILAQRFGLEAGTFV